MRMWPNSAATPKWPRRSLLPMMMPPPRPVPSVMQMTLRWPLPRAELVLAPGGRVGVVLHDDGEAHAGLDLLLQRLLAPVDVRREVDRGALTVDVSGRTDAHADDLVTGACALHRGGDGVHDALGRARGRHLVGREDVAFLVDHTGRDLGAADIDADGESHESLSFGRAPLRPTVPEALPSESRRPPGGQAGGTPAARPRGTLSPGRCVRPGRCPRRRPGARPVLCTSVVAGRPALFLGLDRGAVGGEQFVARGGEVVEDVRVAFDDGLDRGLGLLDDLLHHLLGGGSGDRAEQRGLEAGQLVRDGVDELAQFLGGRALAAGRTGCGGGPSPPRGPRRTPSPRRRRRSPAPRRAPRRSPASDGGSSSLMTDS